MAEEINDDEVLSDSQSISTARSFSSTSSDMSKVNLQLYRDSLTKRQAWNMDMNELPPSVMKQLKERESIKTLIFNGKCSQVFKSTLEDCVEDCILEFPEENNFIYVPKSGQTKAIPAGSIRNSMVSLKEQTGSTQQSTKSKLRRNSINQHYSLPAIGGVRNNLMNNFSLPPMTLAVTTAARMRHQLVQQKFSLNEDISEESTEQQTTIEQPLIPPNMEFDGQSQRSSIHPVELISQHSSSFPHHGISSSSKAHLSFHNRQKDYRLSDLVTFGPEYFSEVFHLPRHPSRRQKPKTAENLTELDRIKQDLFHRYLWTQKPQVSCRIRPLSTYTRSSTFVV